jgi:hypothetical protein
MKIVTNVEHEHSTSKRKKYVRGRGPKTVKSRRGKWVEEDITMDPVDTTNDCIEQKIGQDYNTWDEYFDKIVICGYFVCRENKQSNLI